MITENQITAARISNGFTIIELMLTIALIAVVATVAVPSFETFIERNQLATRINQFSNALSVARSEAIKRKQTVVVCPRGSDDTCQSTPGYESGWIVQVAGTSDVIWVSDPLPPGYTLRGNGSIATQISYRPSGRPVAFGSVTLCRNGQADKARKLILNRTGRVRLADLSDITAADCGVSG